jgi:hypothetical protein
MMSSEQEYMTMTALRTERGWTDGAITKFLGGCDHSYTTKNPYGRGTITVRLYNLARIEQAEATPEFQAWLEKRKSTADKRAAAVEKRKATVTANREAKYADVLSMQRTADNGVTADVIFNFYAHKANVDAVPRRRRDKFKSKTTYDTKHTIIRELINRATEAGWTWGAKRDDAIAGGYFPYVVYFDLPSGQASFHISEYDAATMPAYPGKWSGLRNSDEVLYAFYRSLDGDMDIDAAKLEYRQRVEEREEAERAEVRKRMAELERQVAEQQAAALEAARLANPDLADVAASGEYKIAPGAVVGGPNNDTILPGEVYLVQTATCTPVKLMTRSKLSIRPGVWLNVGYCPRAHEGWKVVKLDPSDPAAIEYLADCGRVEARIAAKYAKAEAAA